MRKDYVFIQVRKPRRSNIVAPGTHLPLLRDAGPYSARNSSKGGLTVEAARVFESLGQGETLEQVRQKAFEGVLFPQRARSTRERIWVSLNQRYLAHAQPWVLQDLERFSRAGTRDSTFLSLLYLHYVLRDRLAYDFVTQVVWERWQRKQVAVQPEDVLSLLDRAASEQPQIRRWSEVSRARLACSILAALRDFGLLEGVRKKRIVRPPLPLEAAEHLVRLLSDEGKRGAEIIEAADWRLFLRSEHEVVDSLTRLSLEKRIRFERAGSTVILEVPEEWATA